MKKLRIGKSLAKRLLTHHKVGKKWKNMKQTQENMEFL